MDSVIPLSATVVFALKPNILVYFTGRHCHRQRLGVWLVALVRSTLSEAHPGAKSERHVPAFVRGSLIV